MKTKYKFRTEVEIRACALCPPPFRMYRFTQIKVGYETDNPEWHEILTPVLAIQSRVESHYQKREEVGEYSQLPETAREKYDAGWRYDGTETIQAAIILDDETRDMLPHDDSMIQDCINSQSCTVLMPWAIDDSEKDREWLAQNRANLRRMVEEKITNEKAVIKTKPETNTVTCSPEAKVH